MFEQELLQPVIYFIIGLIVGVAATLIFNKARTGTASAHKLKKEMEDYQDKVEQHFEQTSQKFKNMTEQYQDLYQHLSVGATTLCRPDNIAPGLSDNSATVAELEAPAKPMTTKAGAPTTEKKQSQDNAEPSALNKEPSADKKPSAVAKEPSVANKESSVAPKKTPTPVKPAAPESKPVKTKTDANQKNAPSEKKGSAVKPVDSNKSPKK